MRPSVISRSKTSCCHPRVSCAAISGHLAREGASVAFGYERSVDAAEALAGKIEASGGCAVGAQMNAANPALIKQAVERAAGELGGLDILVNNAGFWRTAPIDKSTLDDSDAALGVSGASFAPLRRRRAQVGGGRIISIGSSLAARVPDASL